MYIAGAFYSNSDTLTDFGKIEFSYNNGINWIDLLNDTILTDTINNDYWCWHPWLQPVLTGNTNDWYWFEGDIGKLGEFLGIQIGDTVLFRFSFISDSIQSFKDGIMFDDLTFVDEYHLGIKEIKFRYFKSKCFPNPAQETLIIKFENKDKSGFELFVFDITGKQILNRSNIKTKNYITLTKSNTLVHILVMNKIRIQI